MNNIEDILKKTKESSKALINLNNEKIDNVLMELSETILLHKDKIITENKKDLDFFEKNYTKDHPNYDRLMLNTERIESISKGVKAIASQKHIPEILETKKVNNLNISKKLTPFGVILVIFESRPNVTIDVFSLCFKSKNAILMKGGREALHTNKIITELIKNVLRKNNIPDNILNLINAEREEVKFLLNQIDYIDLCISRGGINLIKFVKENSKIPFIETGAGVVHIYIDEDFNEDIAKKVILNSKTRRFSVCNALDCLLFHEKITNKIIEIIKPLEAKNTEIFCNRELFDLLKGSYKFLKLETNNLDGVEFLSNKLLLRSVEDMNSAIKYINKNTSKHSECIITNNKNNSNIFSENIDAAVIYTNTSTAFTDGYMFGLGGEIGISTQKLHTRGPFGFEALKTIKYIIESKGEIRD